MCQAMDELRADFKEEGRAEGREQTMLGDLKNLMTSMKWSLEQAMNALMIPEESRGKIRLLMHERQ